MSKFEEIAETEFTARKESGTPPTRDMTLFARLGCAACPSPLFMKSEDAVCLERIVVDRTADLVQVSSVVIHDVLTATHNQTCEAVDQICPNEANLLLAKEMLLEVK